MEIEIAIFQDKESFGRERISKMTMEQICIIVWKNSKSFLKLSAVVNTMCVLFLQFATYSTKHNPANNYEIYRRK